MALALPPAIDYLDLITSQEPDYNWLIPNLLEVGERLIFTGNEGHGKSTLLRQIALQTSLGIHPFTLEEMQPRRVMVVDLENPPRTVQREFKKFGLHAPERGMLNIHRWPGGIDLLSEESVLAFNELLKEDKPELLIIGPMYKMALLPLEREEHSRRLASVLDLWRSAYDFTLIMESHQPHGAMVPDGPKARFYRPERPIGSSLWLRWPEFGYCLEDAGILRPWRGGRDADRQWPEKLARGDDWLWRVDDRTCQKCGNPLSDKQEKYCSERCRNAAKQSRFRIMHKEPEQAELEEMLKNLQV